MNFGALIVWLIVGALAGSLVGMVVSRKKAGFGRLSNLGIGMVGALIGGAIFDIFNIDLGLGNIAIRFEDLVAAVIGSLIFTFVIWILRKNRKGK